MSLICINWISCTIYIKCLISSQKDYKEVPIKLVHDLTKSPVLPMVYVICFPSYLFVFHLFSLGENTWCIAKPSTNSDILVHNMEYSCAEPYVNCSSIQPGGSCLIWSTKCSLKSFSCYESLLKGRWEPHLELPFQWNQSHCHLQLTHVSCIQINNFQSLEAFLEKKKNFEED